MIAPKREKHEIFFEEELKAQSESFRQKLESTALYLLKEREELFVAQYKETLNGEMILIFSNNRGLPRLNDYLYCFSLPKELRDYKKWDNRTYGDLIKVKLSFSQCFCAWHKKTEDNKYTLAGFRGISISFANHISGSEGIILALGPNNPPIDYITNLQKIVRNIISTDIPVILDTLSFQEEKVPIIVNKNFDTSNLLIDQLQANKKLILQGPPGTGKSYLIAEITKKLCDSGKSVLITSLTNRALIEIVEKPSFKGLLYEKKVYKTNISYDETKNYGEIISIKDIYPKPGAVILASFFATSNMSIIELSNQKFDYVIVDEASQALLAMLAIAYVRGNHVLFIGDNKQLSPVVMLSMDKIVKKNYLPFINGLTTLSKNPEINVYQLSETKRLTPRASKYTGLFYNNNLKSSLVEQNCDLFISKQNLTCNYIHPSGGPTLIKTNMEIGNRKPLSAFKLISQIVDDLKKANPDRHITILTYFVDTTKAIQKYLLEKRDENLLIDTVSRVQGLTTDICIFLIPNSSYNLTLEYSLFNVATSRARISTIIVSDPNILKYRHMDSIVKQYFNELNNEFSFSV